MKTKKHVRRGTMTTEDIKAADRLRRLWKASGKSQYALAALYSDDPKKPVSQGVISQYVNGKIPLGVVATMKFARMFDVSPSDIRPDFAYSDLAPGELPADVLRLAAEIAMFSPEVRADIAQTVDLIRKQGASYHKLMRNLTKKLDPV